MEIMTKEEYFGWLAKEAVKKVAELDEGILKLSRSDDIGGQVQSDLSGWFGLTFSEVDSALNGDLDDVYDRYVEENEKDHIFDVEFHCTVYGTAQVHAKDENEAREYAEEELAIGAAGVYFDDNEKSIDCELDDHGGGLEIDSVDDTGDEYED